MNQTDKPTGVPEDETLALAKQYAESFLGLGEWNKNWDRQNTALWSCLYQGFIAGAKSPLSTSSFSLAISSSLAVSSGRARE